MPGEPPPTSRLRLTLAYQGTPFDGWQSQPTGNAVQDHVEKAFAAIAGCRVVVHGASRTDAGVHALAQVAHAEPPASATPNDWALALNAHLPDGIRVTAVSRASPAFHARYSASGKTYEYRIWNARYLHPLERGRAWHIPSAIDDATLAAATRRLAGRHDFALLSANRRTVVRSTIRTVHSIDLRRSGPLLRLRFRGDGFLYKMIRILVGASLRCARGQAGLDWIDQLLAGATRRCTFCAPAEGLYLVEVHYARGKTPAA
jgi:tRNA pseudouridine38-40 synthase